MRQVPAAMTAAWQSETKIGPQRPVVRATIQRTVQRRWTYDTANMKGGDYDTSMDRHTAGTYTSVIFGNHHSILEIRNIRSCTWSRTTDQDVATCTLVLNNIDHTPIGNQDETDPNDDMDQPGYFTYSRGSHTGLTRWGYQQNGWTDVLVPDMLVKTYEGYGVDSSVGPASDTNLVQSGTWLIDKVTYTHDGLITIEMRDLGRLLMDQIAFPPVVPFSEYPMSWSKIRTDSVAGRDVTGGAWKTLSGRGTAHSSNEYYIGKGLTNGTAQYVDSKGGVSGHYASHALVNNTPTVGETLHYWLSTGQNHQDDPVWWEVDLFDHTTALNGLRIQTVNTAYVYISLMGSNGWIGRKHIPYTPEGKVGGVDIGADIPFVTKVRAEAFHTFDVTLPRKYADIKRIRLTFTNLAERSFGRPHPFQAALFDLQMYTAASVSSLGFQKGQILKTVGNYNDYTQVVLWACAWAGFWHPDVASGDDFIKIQGDEVPVHLRKNHKSLARGGVWGNLQPSGTAGVADLTPDLFDKKPLLDMVNYVRDILGFVFWVDEYGAVQFRLPNIWSLGNYVWEGGFESREDTRARSSEVLELDEEEVLFSYSTTLNSSNIRERIFVANSSGGFGAVVEGYNPQPMGMRRVAGWTDQHFETKRETVIVADMIAARSMFDYRRGNLKMAGYPKLQIDDQVRIFERTTNETYYHYVLGITSTLDMEEGTWDYDVETHWLGESPSDAWVVDVTELKAETRAYLNTIGA